MERLPVTRRRALALVPMVMAGTVLQSLDRGRGPSLRHMVIDPVLGRLEAPAPFSLVGLSWPPGRGPGGPVHIRASFDGWHWTSWTELSRATEEAPDVDAEGAGVQSSSPVWTGPGRFIDLRWQGHMPRGASLHLIDPGPDPRLPSSAAMAAAPRPGIITRAQWGADEAIRRGEPEYSEPLQLAIVHHTATANHYSRGQSGAIVRSIYAFHVNVNGWDDIGYNFLIDRFGQVFEGRAGGVTRAVTGAHARGFNSHSVGIAIIGSYLGAKPPEAAMQGLRQLLAWRLDVGFVDPTSTFTYRSRGSNKWPEGTAVSLGAISAHRQVVETACPGGPMMDSLNWVRRSAYDTGLPKMFEPRVSRSAVVPGSDPLHITARLSSPRSWTVEVLDGNDQVRWSARGSGSSLSATWNGRDSSGNPLPHGEYRLRVGGRDVRTFEQTVHVWRWPAGTFFFTSRRHSYVFLGGRLRPPSSAVTLGTWYGWEERVDVPHEIVRAIPIGSPLGFRDGSMVRLDSTTFLISEGRRRPVAAATLQRMGFNLSATIRATEKDLSSHPLGPNIRVGDAYPMGSALESSLGQEARVTSSGIRLFASRAARESHRIRGIELAKGADVEALGALTKSRLGFRDGTLARNVLGQTFVIADGKRRAITEATMRRMGYKEQNVRLMGIGEQGAHEAGPPL